MPDFLKSLNTDASWTLFLDRDGVLNRRLIDAYVRHVGEWEWLPGVTEALARLSQHFGQLVVVTNQRGIARELMSEADLAEVHAHMLSTSHAAGGQIDAVYYCPHDRGEGCECRKPKPGMLLQAAQDHPEVDLRRAIMVGDSPSDIAAAQAAGVVPVRIGQADDPTEEGSVPTFLSLLDLAHHLFS